MKPTPPAPAPTAAPAPAPAAAASRELTDAAQVAAELVVVTNELELALRGLAQARARIAELECLLVGGRARERMALARRVGELPERFSLEYDREGRAKLVQAPEPTPEPGDGVPDCGGEASPPKGGGG